MYAAGLLSLFFFAVEQRFILRSQPGSDRHDGKSDKVSIVRNVAEYGKRQQRAYERGYGIIRAAAGSP